MSVGLSQSITTRFILWRLAWQSASRTLQQHLFASLPRWVLSWFSDQEPKVIYSLSGPEIVARWVKGSCSLDWNTPEAGAKIEATSNTAPKMLIVPDGLILRQELELPLLSLLDLKSAIANNLQTWTPFSAEEVFFDARIERTKHDVAFITLIMLPRARLKELERTFQVTFDEISLDGRTLPIKKQENLKLRYLNIFLVITLVCSCVAGFLLLQNRLEQAQLQITNEKSRIVKNLQVQKALEDRLSSLLNQAAFLDDRQKYHQPLLPAMSQIASALPANVSLASFELLRNNGSIVVVFQELPSEDMLRSIILRCNVCKNEYAQINRERFEINFRLGGS